MYAIRYTYVVAKVVPVREFRTKLSELLSSTSASELMITISASGPSERISSLERTRELFGPNELPQGLAATGALAFPRPQEDETVTA